LLRSRIVAATTFWWGIAASAANPTAPRHVRGWGTMRSSRGVARSELERAQQGMERGVATEEHGVEWGAARE
jgi:hypothetical protein